MEPRPQRILDYSEYPVLYVDDEPENLRIFELTFRREFQIFTARSGSEGLEILNREPVAVVLSDQRMPGMSGVEFLARVRELDPKTVRVLVTAYGDADVLAEAINNGSIYRYVPKPWTPEDVRLTLRRGIEVYALDRERDQLLKELVLLNRISGSINSKLELDPLLDLILDTVTGDLGYDGAALLFFEEGERRLAFSRLRPDQGAVPEGLRRQVVDCDAAPVFVKRLRDGAPQCLAMRRALELEAPVRRWITEVAAEETLVLPLLGKRGAIGALVVDNRSGGGSFDASDQTLLEGLANHAVIAIENARLVEDLRRSREQILRADRLGTLGTLAAGLAHEINNPLVSIHTFLAMAPSKREVDDPEFWRDYHELASREVDRIRRLVDTMRRLGRDEGDGAPRESVDPVEVSREVLALLQREAREAQVELSLEVDGEVPKLVAVRDHLHQVLMNLVMNALHVSQAGDAVAVRVFAEPEGRGARLEVSDRGPGIAEEDLERVFDPFFTTKGPDHGTGLGLMICHRLVTDHGGRIEVRSRPGEGATFSVHLPLGYET